MSGRALFSQASRLGRRRLTLLMLKVAIFMRWARTLALVPAVDDQHRQSDSEKDGGDQAKRHTDDTRPGHREAGLARERFPSDIDIDHAQAEHERQDADGDQRSDRGLGSACHCRARYDTSAAEGMAVDVPRRRSRFSLKPAIAPSICGKSASCPYSLPARPASTAAAKSSCTETGCT